MQAKKKIKSNPERKPQYEKGLNWERNQGTKKSWIFLMPVQFDPWCLQEKGV
jgi:hypothetical protein